MKKFHRKTLTKPLILLVCFAILAVLRPNSFPTVSNLSNVLWSISVYGIMTSGTIFVFLLGGIDLSIGSLCGLSSVACVMTIRAMGYTNAGVVCGVLAALAVGLAAGLFHGVIITRFKVPAFLITFASSTAYLGLSMVLTGNKILSCMEPPLFVGISTFKILGFPVPVYIMLVIAVVSWFVLAKTSLGRRFYAVGGNATASRLSGINDTAVTILAYVLSGLTTSIGGIVLASMTQQCMASTGSGYENYVIMSAVIGGISLLGGVGTVPGCVFGAILIGLLNNGLNLMSVPSTEHDLVKGVVIIAAVAFDALQHQDKAKSWMKQFCFCKKKEVT